MFRRIFASGVVFAAVVAAGGCSDDSGDGPTTSPFAERPSFEARLEMIPASAAEVNDEDSAVTVAMADLDRAAELAGLERPEDVDDQDAVVDYVLPITGIPRGDEDPPPVAALLPEASQYNRSTGRTDEFADEVGWSLVDISWFIEYQVPPGVFTVMGGRFEEDRLTEAMGQPEDDIWQLGGEDLETNLEEQSVARPMGESLRLALDDGRLNVGRATPPVEDALEGSDETLADDQVLRSMAAALDDEEAYSAMLVTGREFDPESAMGERPLTEEGLARIEEEALPEPFDGVAVGLAHEDDQAVAVFVYTHEDEDAAEANAEALQGVVEEGISFTTNRPWSDLFSVDEIRTDGSTVVARLDIPSDRPAAQVYNVIRVRDSLVTHG